MARPGIMLYFDILEPIRVLSDAEKGRLLVAMLEYGQSGADPAFDGMLALAWGFVKPKLDRDEESYEEAKEQRKYAAFCKKRNGLGLQKISFDEWQVMDNNERLRMVTEGNEPLRAVVPVASRYPSTTATASASASSTASASAAAVTTGEEIAATAAKEFKFLCGELGKGVVLLTDEQIELLLDQMDVDAFDYYVDKLSSFIIKNDAKVKNHFGTILKWWHEDSNAKT